MEATRWIAQSCKRTLLRLSTKNYHFARAYGRLNSYWLNSDKQSALIIFQMGKVGSTSVYSSLKSLHLNMPVYHVHFLTYEGIHWASQVYRQGFSRTGLIGRHIFDSLHLRQQLDKGLPENGQWKIVSLVRDPIARNISAFFQTLNLEFPEFDYEKKIGSVKSETLVKELIPLFWEKFNHDFPLTWFDTEMKSVFNVDVFASDFPEASGYKIYTQGKADLLLFKLETLEKCAPRAFNCFLGIKNFELLKANEAQEKKYYNVYRQFLDNITFPASYIDRMYKSKYVRHFYSEAEIETFRDKWLH